ncbi:MAG: DUF2793 domain-containing protein [Rhizobiales bacterium]|nr:DUF2793 domain-containing protein [Hyphomicrobiales bacterium]
MTYDKVVTNPGVWTVTLTSGSAAATVAGILLITAGARAGDAVLDDDGRILVIKDLTETTVTFVWPYKASTRTIDLVVEKRSINRALNTATSAAAVEALATLQLNAALSQTYPVLGIFNTLPTTPTDGDRILIGAAPTGVIPPSAAKNLAVYSSAIGAWSYTAPIDGMSVVLAGTSTRLQYNGVVGTWASDALLSPGVTVAGRMARFTNTSGGVGQSQMSEDGSGNVSIAGSISATGAAKRFLADFSNATQASRTMFQTSAADSFTSVGALPSGTGAGGYFQTYAGSDPANASIGQFGATGANITFRSTVSGAGVLRPLQFSVGGVSLFSLSETANRFLADFSTATVANRFMFQTSVANGATNVMALPSGTGTVGQFIGVNNSDPTNASLAQIAALASEISIRSGISGAGSYLPLTFYSGGTERARIATDGKIYIGTTPAAGSQMLNVGGHAQFGAPAGPGVRFQAIGLEYWLTGINHNNDTNSPIVISGNGSANLTVGTNGNVRVGDAGMATNVLEVAKAQNAPTTFLVANYNSGTSASANMQIASTTGVLQYRVVENAGAPYAQVVSNASVNAFYTDFALHVWRSQAGTERMRIHTDGNVGIGVTPAYKLDVAGDARIGTGSGTAVMRVNGGNTGSADGGAIYFQNAGASSVSFGNESAILGGGYSRNLLFYANGLQVIFDALSLRPRTDNTLDVGTASFRPKQYYGVATTISTSDVREKFLGGTASDALLLAAFDTPLITFQWLDSVAEKGADQARHHYGPTAQGFRDACLARGVDPTRHAAYCEDEITTKEVRTRKVARQKTETVTVRVQEVQIIDSVPVRRTVDREERRPMFDQVAVVDEAGEPVMNSDDTPVTHPVPVMEDIIETYEIDVPRLNDDGTPYRRLGLRLDQFDRLRAEAVRRIADGSLIYTPSSAA